MVEQSGFPARGVRHAPFDGSRIDLFNRLPAADRFEMPRQNRFCRLWRRRGIQDGACEEGEGQERSRRLQHHSRTGLQTSDSACGAAFDQMAAPLLELQAAAKASGIEADYGSLKSIITGPVVKRRVLAATIAKPARSQTPPTLIAKRGRLSQIPRQNKNPNRGAAVSPSRRR